MVDHNDVNIIDDEMEDDEEEGEDEEEDEEGRPLNRQTGNVNFHQAYGDEDDEEDQVHSSRQDGMLDQHDYDKNSRQILDDQNLMLGQMDGEEEEEEEMDEEEQQYEGQIDFDNIDPELLEAAQKLGLNEEGIMALQRQMYEQQNAEEQEDEYAEEMEMDDENL